MKILTGQQINQLKPLAIEALKGMNFNAEWIEKLTYDLNNDQDQPCNAFELANYISWHMRDNSIHPFNVTLADKSAFQAVLFAANELLYLSN